MTDREAVPWTIRPPKAAINDIRAAVEELEALGPPPAPTFIYCPEMQMENMENVLQAIPKEVRPRVIYRPEEFFTKLKLPPDEAIIFTAARSSQIPGCLATDYDTLIAKIRAGFI